MKILFEGCRYETRVLKKVINRHFYTPDNGSTYSKVERVGYYYDSEAENPDAVIILPKVFIDKEGLAFGEDPKAILEYNKETRERLRKTNNDAILFNISTWIYQAIKCFRKRHSESKIVNEEQNQNIISNYNESDSTELDIILTLLKFHKDNQQLFTYIAKINNSGRKINWTKTVTKKTPIISNNTPIYAEVVAKKKCINFDEEIIIMFYSTMNYICDKYGFEASINQNYELIKGDKFKQLMTKGTRKLKSIKYKYFTDKFIEMWKLLYTFFDKAESAQRGKSRREEMLLVRNFNIVFEDMIDDLIGDKIEDLPKNLKDQNDGKIVDHIFKYQSLVIEDDIYFVGDSKYYKSNAQIEKKSIEKQYTYARNIIQHSINLFNNHKLPGNFRYRDNDTEGYNITPNFFISAFIEKPYDTTTDGLDTDGRDPKKYTYTQSHFNNRLFDRDTLTVQRYNINFLYVLSAYTSKGSMTKVLFKNKAQSKFRDELIKYFISTYTFHQVTPIDGIDIKDFINKYFRLLIGKMYKPSQITGSIILAFNKEDNMNSVYSEAFKQECANLGLNDFEADCKIDDYKLGE